jgi:hypothetical protein
LCSESTAFNSRETQECKKSGEWKKEENRERAPANAVVDTEKKYLVLDVHVYALDEPLFLARNYKRDKTIEKARNAPRSIHSPLGIAQFPAPQ